MQIKSKNILCVIIILIIMTILGGIYWRYIIKQTEQIDNIEQTDTAHTDNIEQTDNDNAETIDDVKTIDNAEIIIDKTIEITTETETDKEVDTDKAIQPISPISLGEFKLTAYCSCEICCGEYALNRPLDENGNKIVYGSIGERLIAGTSIAVDPNVIPYGTEVVINEHTYIAQDTGGAIDGNRIDVYFDNHQEALNFGVQYTTVYIKEN